MTEFRVAVVGDSVVWGQGLPREATFAALAAGEIAARADRDLVVVASRPRSGAKILAAEDDGPGEVVTPSGRRLSVSKGDRTRFYDLYPAFFTTDEQVEGFFDRTDEELAAGLFGDIPATFPTVTYQVDSLPDALSRDVDLVIADGGSNDVDFEGVLDPTGPSVREVAEAVHRFCYRELRKLLFRLRRKFPRAVLVVTGYYTPLSTDSDHDELVRMAKFLSERPGWLLAVNDAVVSPLGGFPLLPRTPLGVDVGAEVTRAIRRADFGHRRALYWMRRAVAEFDAEDTGPGMVFAHAGFRAENALFASGTAFVHEGYQPPGAGNREVRDALLDQRRRAIPRGRHLAALKAAAAALLRLAETRPRPQEVTEILGQLAELRRALDGPTSLLGRLDEVAAASADARPGRARLARPRVEAEIGRIEIATIASFLHPTEAGARRYADVIVDRYARHTRRSIRRELGRLGGGRSVRAALRRYGLPATGLRTVLAHATVDTLAVEMPATPLPDLVEGLFPLFLLTGGDRRFRLEHADDGLCVVDTFGTLPLGEVTRLALELGDGVSGRLTIGDVRLRVNGVPVFSSAGRHTLVAGRPLAFPYPVAAELVVEPALLDFGTVPLRTSRSQTVRVANRTGARATVSVAAARSGPFRWPALDTELADRQEVRVAVDFRPEEPGSAESTLTVVAGGREHRIRLAGRTGGFEPEDPDAPQPPPPPPRSLVVSPTLLAFGALRPGTVQDRTVTITNPTAAAVTISVAGPPPGPFGWAPVQATLPPGGRREVSVRFGPVPAGLSSGALTVTSSAPGGPHRVSLGGRSTGGLPTPGSPDGPDP